MIGQHEKELAVKTARDLKLAMSQEVEEKRAFCKVLVNYIGQTNPVELNKLPLPLNNIDELSPKELDEIIEDIFLQIVEVGTREETRQYTTGEMAKFFGVTVATINNWIKEERILGVKKDGRFSQARIPETAIYISHANERIPIKHVIDLYKQEQEESSLRIIENKVELIQEVIASISFYEKKYGGKYYHTLGQKKYLTPDESRDNDEWKYLLRELNELYD